MASKEFRQMHSQQPKRETNSKIEQCNFDANMLGENYARLYCFIYESHFARVDSLLCLCHILHVLLLIIHFVLLWYSLT